jgi:hypothetical protein
VKLMMAALIDHARTHRKQSPEEARTLETRRRLT